MASVDDAVVETWEPWQREYRHGVLLVYPPPGIIEAVDALRAEHDPTSHASSRAHITVTEPLPRPLDERDVDRIRSALRGVTSFRVTYSGPRSTDPHPGVVYRIEPQDRFRSLRDLLHRQPVFDGVEPRRDHIPAHMTIAEFLTVEQSNRLAGRLSGTVPEGTWICDAVSYAVPDADFRFRRRLELLLGGR